jgi:glycosyltransferase involved in cell wall biosynthesis
MIPTVSVIVSSYNYGRYVGAALESVRRQTFSDFEAIVIDDGSTDDSRRVIRGFLADPRFRLITQNHGGQSRAKNRGLTEARAPYVAFLDADDLWARTKLEKQVALMESDPRVGVTCTRRKVVDADGKPRPWSNRRLPRGNVVAAMFRQNFVCFSSAMLRAGVADHVGGFDESIPLAIDYDFWLRAARHYRFGVVDEPLVAYRVGHVNLSRRQLERLHVARLIMERFTLHFDRPGTLPVAARARAEAETFVNMATIARGYSRRAALAWLARAIRANPRHLAAWRQVAAAIVPNPLRRLLRRLRGASGGWERACHTPFNRPEAVL